MTDLYKNNQMSQKVALVTGGASGIGLACVRQLLRYGAKGVAIVDTQTDKGTEAVCSTTTDFGPNRSMFIKSDCSKPTQMQCAFKTTLERFNQLDIVINNAGILNDAQWEYEIAVNCGHVVQGCLLAMRYMGTNNCGKGGVVINMSSILGLEPISGAPVYVGTKHFIIGLTRAFGTRFYEELTGVQFMALCPGVTQTSMIDIADEWVLRGYPNLIDTLKKDLGSFPKQGPDCVAEALMRLLLKPKNGSVWVAEGDDTVYEVKIPERKSMRASAENDDCCC